MASSSLALAAAPAPYAHVMKSSWTVGIDLGQSNDPTAFCAVERLRWYSTIPWNDKCVLLPGLVALPLDHLDGKKPPDALHIRALQRLPLATSYIEIAQQLAVMLGNSKLRDAKVFVDATGVGKPVVDLLSHAGIKHTPIWITGGNEQQSHNNGYSVPKLLLISRLQAALHSGELKIAKALPEAQAFTRELQEFRVTWTEFGNMRFGAKQGAHDDLVLAASLAVYGATSLSYETSVKPLIV